MAGSYSEEEAQEILRRASAMQTTGFMSRDELVRAAGELGITPEAMEQAERDYQESRAEEDLRMRFRAKRRGDLFDSFKAVLAYGVIGGLLARSNHNWFWIVVVVVTIASLNLLMNFWLAFFESKASRQRGFEEFKAKESRRKNLVDRRTNDKIIADILQGTPGNKKLEVIKNLRETTGLPLNEAKNAVEDYYGRHPEVLRQSS